MIDFNERDTQRDLGFDAVKELRTAGFEDAAEIGLGGFGVVYRCTQPALDRMVAVKVLTCELDANRERFFREQRAMGRLTGHPNIVDLLEAGETASGRPYLVMPYHRLGSLDGRIRTDGPLPLEQVLRLGVKMAGALETAHRAEIVHRDVKPANILLTDYGEPALADFGIAHLVGGFRTSTGTVSGTPAFTAPEVLEGDAPSRASDVYGLGTTLFCALTGHAAFERRSGEQVVAQFLRITTQPIPDLRERGIPNDVCAIIEAAMARQAQDRPTAAELGEQLQRAQLAHGGGADHMALRTESGGMQRESSVSALPSVWGDARDLGIRLSTSGGNLPRELTSFVGRRRQILEVKNLLAGSPLVTLTGIGGVGKSRLALRAAHKLREDFADKVWLVELSDIRDPSLLVDVVTAAFGLKPRGDSRTGRPMFELLVEFLRTREVLIVLDNCEHMIESVAKLVESLLRACQNLRILATSREALGIGGEAVLAVPPLRFPSSKQEPSTRRTASYDAVALFTERAVAALPSFQLTEDNRADVVSICARLDGLPLAIELAAARLRTMSVEQINARLTDLFSVLTRGTRGAPDRQQTLALCIGWSYDLCSPAEHRLWARLSVFAGSFELDAAEAVCGADLTEPEFIDALSALVDKSILFREESGAAVRFRLLETVREYGIKKLKEAGESAELRRRHRDWFQRLAVDAEADWVSSRQLEWIGRIRRELPNFRKALEISRSEADPAGLRTAAALYNFWSTSGRYNEGRSWCDRMLVATPDAPAFDRGKALYASVALAAVLGDLEVATARVAELRTLAEVTADSAIAALLAYSDGYIALSSGDLASAETRLTEAVEAFGGAREDDPFRVRALVHLGWTFVLKEDMPRAVACLDEARRIAVSHDDTYFRSLALRPMAVAVWRQGKRERAIQLLEEALQLARRLADPLVAATRLEVMAWIAADKREAKRAAKFLGAAYGLGHSVGASSTIIYPHLLVHHEECERNLRDILGPRAYESAYREGAAMSCEAAIDFALGERDNAKAATDRESAGLTKREREIVDLIAEGLSNKAIATRLVISQRTAEGHVEHILTKLGFTSRTQVAAWAAEQPRD